MQKQQNIETKTWNLIYSFSRKSQKFLRFPNFLFCPIPKIENSKILESGVLLQILIVVVT